MIELRFALLLVALLASRLTADDIFVNPGNSDTAELVGCFDDLNLRQGASNALVTLGDAAVEQLAAALSAPSLDVRIWSAYTLGRIGPEASEAAGLLAGMLDSDHPDQRAVAARSLGQIGVADEIVVAGLAQALTDDDERVREWSAAAIGQIGPDAEFAIPELIEALHDQSIRRETVRAIVEIGAAAVPSLIAAVEDETIRLDVSVALREIDPDASREAGVETTTTADLPALRIALGNADRDEEARIEVAILLGQLGTEAAPILMAVFGDTNEDVSKAAAAAFAEIGSEAVPLLQEAITNESPVIRARAADALGAIGPDAHVAVGDLITALEDTDRMVKHRAVNALDELNPAAEAAVPGLIAVMNNPRDLEATRQLALKVLSRTGPESRETVIAALRAATEDDNYGISSLAEQMLKRIAPDATE